MADFGLSKRIEETSKSTDRLFGVIPYIDPKCFDNYKLNKKSDIYSLGVLLWELSSGYTPFRNKDYNLHLILEISKGLREDYFKLYTGNYSIYIFFFYFLKKNFMK